MGIGELAYVAAIGGGLAGYYFWQQRRAAGAQVHPAAPVCGEEEVRIRAALRQGDVGPLGEVLGRNRGNFELVDLLIAEVIDEAAPYAAFERLAEAQQESPLARLCHGVCLVVLAWEARGRGVASTVSEGGAELFERHLRHADAELEAAARLDPADPTPWAHRITVARGLSSGEHVARAYLEEAIRRDPWNVSAHHAMLWLLSKRWGGSHEKMLAFARESAARAGEGSPLGFLIAAAHVLVEDHMINFDKDEKGARAYVNDPGVRAEVDRACDAMNRRFPELRPSTLVAHNHFAYWYYVAGDKERCRAELALLQGRFTTTPWKYVGGPGQASGVLQAWLAR